MPYLKQFNAKSFVDKNIFDKSKIVLNPDLPKISIIIASYNQDQYLERTILSIINQNYPNTEIIIIDGESTDASISIIKKYENHLYHWVSEKDSGQANAINKGLKMATGQLLCFQNSDDLFYPNSFSTLSDFYLVNKNMDGYYGDLLIIDENDNVTEELKTIDFNLNAQVLEGMQIFNQSFYFTKTLLEKNGYIDESLKFVIDYENVLRWASKGAKFAKIDGIWGAFRIHGDSKTSNLEHVRKAEHEAIKQKYQQLLYANKANLTWELLKIRLMKFFYFIKKGKISYIKYRFFR